MLTMAFLKTAFLCLVCLFVAKIRAQNGIPEGAATLAFVFDTTGSMYDDLVQVRAGASKILSETLKQRVKPLYNYAIVPFHDPDVGPASITTDDSVFQDHLNNLYVQGGGDCPEMSLSAIMLALEISLPGSFIYVFTDAQAKDMHLKEKVLRLVQLKQSQINFVLTGDCHNKTVDPEFTTYKLISATSTGQVFNLKKKDVNQILKFAEESVRANKVNLLSVDVPEAGTRSFVIPIDEALERVTVSLSGKGAKLVITDPDGNAATGLQNLLNLKSAVSVALNKPRPGLWNVTVGCDGGFALRVTGLSVVHFVYGFSLSAVDNMDDLLRRPAGGFSNFAVIRVQGLLDPGLVNKVQLLDLQGTVFREVRFNPRPDDQYTFDWIDFEPPPGLFYIRIAGVDRKGNWFHRCSPTGISAILPEAPKIKGERTREVLVGSPVTLGCTIESVVPCKSYWARGPVTVTSLLTRTGVFNSTYTISSASKKDEGVYTCYGKNVGGTSKLATRLTVKVPLPVFIEKDEVSLTVKSGDTIVLRCAADTKFPVTFSWFKDGQRIQDSAHARQQSNGSLFLDIKERQDAGRYRCIAKSEVGQIARTTLLNVNEPPFVVIDTATKNFQQGEEIQVACLVKGFPEPAVVWNKEGQRIIPSKLVKISPDHLLIIQSAKPSDAGKYECVATNVVGTSKAFIQLQHTVPPTVYVDHEDVIVKKGDSITLECRANAQPTPTIQWYKGRYAIVPSRRITTSSRGHLVINAVQKRDAGFYTCVAINVAGSDSVRVSFSVQVPPRVTVEKSSVFLVPGGNNTVQCSAVGIPPPAVNWYKEKKSLGPVGRIHANDAGELVITNAILEDAGIYTCTAKSDGGSTSVDLKVLVGGAPEIIAPPTDKAVTLGEKVTFQCKATGVPTPKIQWYNGIGSISNGPHYHATPDGNLHIYNVRVKDAGKYTCIAKNDFGQSEATAMLMLVGLTAPTITKDVNNTITATAGYDTEIACPAQGIPTPEVTWSREGYPINSQNSSQKFKVKSTGSLVITSLTADDTGLYTCTAVNAAGSDSYTYVLFIKVPPTIVKPPRDVIVNVNDVITLECGVSGLPLPDIKWQFNNVTLHYTQSKITITNVTVFNGGSYRCVASSDAGMVTAEAVVHIQGPPSIVHQDIDTFSGDPGDAVQLPCKALGYPQPVISWLKDGLLLTFSDGKYHQDPSGSLRVSGLAPDDTGTYTCQATNQKGFDSVNLTVIVKMSPTIVRAPQNMTVTEGSTVSLECVTRGVPLPRITWTHNGKVLPDVESKLVIKNADKRQDGFYECTASNAVGEIRVGSIVKILSRVPPTEQPTDDTKAQGSRPVFTSIPQDTEAEVGSTLLWNCTATGSPRPVFRWQKDGKDVQFNITDRLTILPNSSLQIRNVKPHDEGTYRCLATISSLVTAVQAILTVKVHGGWGEWQAWGPCSHSCATGTRTRHRACDNPSPANGGRYCPDSDLDKTVCNTQDCPVHGNWSEWGAWSPCLITCGSGNQVRTRTCTRPSPSLGGDDCFGSNAQLRVCNKNACPREGGTIGGLSRLGGHINDVMLPKMTLKANLTRRETNITELSCSIEGLPNPFLNWLKYAVPMTAPLYWAGSSGQPGTRNGLERTQGQFNFSTRIGYPNGEVLSIEHVSQGLNKHGEMVMDVNIRGHTPKYPPQSKVTFKDYKEMFVLTGSGRDTAISKRFFKVDNETLQYLCNNTVVYKDSAARPGSLAQTIEVMDVDVNERPGGKAGAIGINVKTFIKRSPFPQECPQGLVKDAGGEFCQDMDECLFKDTCEHICKNEFATFKCLCRPGFKLQDDNKSCKDIDECALPTTTCPAGHYCVNTVGSYSCRRECRAGYTRSADGNCVDVNECERYSIQPRTQDPCTHRCENNIGSYKCSCNQGYELDNDKCIDIDECVEELCLQGCENLDGSFRCLCFEGYKAKSKTMCEDIDECKENATLCGSMQCTNTDGSYNCLKSCKKGYKRTLQDKCVDLNECKEGAHNCKFNHYCMNTVGSFYCMCPRGYKRMKRHNEPCEDLNECEQFPGICQYGCKNTQGSYKCLCPPGGSLNTDGRTCSGVDECVMKNLRCGQRCAVSPAGSSCACFKGYRLHTDKQGCVDVNECLSNKTNTCQFECVNTMGSYKCRCPAGYKLSTDGKRCQDIDECAINPALCRVQKGRCMNTRGSYRCIKTECPDNYNVVRPGYCLQPCKTGRFCVPQALRYYTAKLSVGVPANQDLLHLIPYYPSYLHVGLLICDFKYYFPDKSTPFGVKQIGNQAVIFTSKPLTQPGMHRLEVKANIKYPDGSLACVTHFTVYVDVAKYLF